MPMILSLCESLSLSAKHRAAVDIEDFAVDVRGKTGGEEENWSGYLVCCGDSAERNQFTDFANRPFIIQSGARHIRLQPSRALRN